jgi:predicted lipid carrier protein YhbT
MSTPLMDPAQFAAMVRDASDEDLAAGLRANRELILDGIFDAMPQAFDAAAAGGLSAVAEWRIAVEPEAPPVTRRVRIADSRCTVSRETEGDADVVYELGGVDFLRLTTGQLDGPQLFVTGRLRIIGDLMLAARMPAMFKPPTPPA